MPDYALLRRSGTFEQVAEWISDELCPTADSVKVGSTFYTRPVNHWAGHITIYNVEDHLALVDALKFSRIEIGKTSLHKVFEDTVVVMEFIMLVDDFPSLAVMQQLSQQID